MNPEQGMLEVQKENFTEALRNLPARSPARNRPLKDLVNQYRNYLGDCNDIVPMNLSRFDLPELMTFSNLIYEVTYA